LNFKRKAQAGAIVPWRWIFINQVWFTLFSFFFFFFFNLFLKKFNIICESGDQNQDKKASVEYSVTAIAAAGYNTRHWRIHHRRPTYNWRFNLKYASIHLLITWSPSVILSNLAALLRTHSNATSDSKIITITLNLSFLTWVFPPELSVCFWPWPVTISYRVSGWYVPLGRSQDVQRCRFYIFSFTRSQITCGWQRWISRRLKISITIFPVTVSCDQPVESAVKRVSCNHYCSQRCINVITTWVISVISPPRWRSHWIRQPMTT